MERLLEVSPTELAEGCNSCVKNRSFRKDPSGCREFLELQEMSSLDSSLWITKENQGSIQSVKAMLITENLEILYAAVDGTPGDPSC